jgi:cystathionine gamma-lyase
MQNHSPNLKFASLAVHAGQDADELTGAVIPSISLSTTFKQSAPAQHKGFEYSRSGNPTRNRFEEAVAALEGGNFGIAFASGSACTTTVVNMLPSGSHVLVVNDVYGGTFRYFTKVAANNGVESTFVDLSDPSNLLQHWQPNTRMVWFETPTNPTLRLVDIYAVSNIAHEKDANVIVVVDNTFMSPYNQQPLSLGADVVVHSVTKYLGGHSDVVMGMAVVNDEALGTRLRFLQNAIGAVPSPFDCWLANRGLKTLHLRMKAHEANAMSIASWLSTHAEVTQVIYPGLPSHPQYELAKKQQKGFGGMLSFRLKGDGPRASRFLSNLQLFALAESLGGVEVLQTCVS